MRAAALDGPKRADAGGREVVHQPRHQRRLWAHHDEVDFALAREGHQVVVGEAFDPVAGDPGVARGGEQVRLARAAGQRTEQSVLAPATTDHQDLGQSAEMKSSMGMAESVS